MTRADSYLGRVLGQAYRLEALLGEGGFGAVYRAEQLSVGRTVAVKVIRPERVRDEAVMARIAARFRREALATSRLAHPNTIRLFDYGEDPDGTLFLVLELLEGRDLERELMFEHTIAPRRTAHIARQVCASLAEAHARGMVHRDLKPSNVFLCDYAHAQDFAKVLDFGIAKVAIEEGASKLTETGTTFGTPMYMAPEQVQGLEPTPAADLYSLGCVLFEMLSGDTVFTGPTALSVSLAHIQKPPPELVIPTASEATTTAWRDLVGRLLAKNPADRPASATAVGKELEALEALCEPLEHVPGHPPAVRSTDRQPRGFLSTHDRGVVTPTPTSLTARPKGTWWAAAAISAAVLGLTGVLLWRQAPSPQLDLAKSTLPVVALPAAVTHRAEEGTLVGAEVIPPTVEIAVAPTTVDAAAVEDAKQRALGTPGISAESELDVQHAAVEAAPEILPPTRLVLTSEPPDAQVSRWTADAWQPECTTTPSCSIEFGPDGGTLKLRLTKRGRDSATIEFALSAGEVREARVTLARAGKRPRRAKPTATTLKTSDGPPTDAAESPPSRHPSVPLPQIRTSPPLPSVRASVRPGDGGAR